MTPPLRPLLPGDVDPPDEALLGAVRRMWDRLDPPPAELPERVRLVLSLHNVEVELPQVEPE